MCPRAGQRGDRWHAYVIPEQQRRRSGATAATVQNDVVGTGFEGEVDVSLDVVGGELESDRDAARAFPDLVSEPSEVADRSRRVERRRRNRVLTRLEPPGFGDPLGDFGCRKMPPGAGLRALTALEVERLHVRQQVPAPAELSRRQLVQIAAVRSSLLSERTAFSGADSGTGELSALSERNLGLLRERAETHVGDEQRDAKHERPLRARADRQFSRHRSVIRQRFHGHLRGQDLNVVPVRKHAARNTHRPDLTVPSHCRQPVASHLVDESNRRFLRRGFSCRRPVGRACRHRITDAEISHPGMAAVAVGRARRALALAQMGRSALRSFEPQGRNFGSHVRSVAEGLAGRQAAAAPVVLVPFLQIDRDRP